MNVQSFRNIEQCITIGAITLVLTISYSVLRLILYVNETNNASSFKF